MANKVNMCTTDQINGSYDFMHEIFRRDVNGEIVSPDDEGYEMLIGDIFETIKIATGMNTGYHTSE